VFAALSRTLPVSHMPILSPDEIRALEQIVVEWNPQELGRSRNVHENH